jgi:hypothetical protein
VSGAAPDADGTAGVSLQAFTGRYRRASSRVQALHVLPLAAFAVGCISAPFNSPIGSEAGMVQIEVVSYSNANHVLTVVAAITNSSNHPIFVLATSGSALERLERLTDAGWHPIHRVSPAVLEEPLRLAPRAAYRDTAVLNLVRGVIPTVPAQLVAGQYRAVYAIFTAWNPAVAGRSPPELVPQAARTSDTFSVRDPDLEGT